MTLAEPSRSVMVSNSGTAMMAADASPRPRYRPASLRRMLTSSRSDTLSHLEMM